MSNILHLDNNKFFIEQVKWVMEDFDDVNYEPALTTMEANEKLENQTFDLLVVDLMLKNDFNSIDGIEFIEEIHEQNSHQKIMVLSARGDRAFRERLYGKVQRYETKDDIEEACINMVNLIK